MNPRALRWSEIAGYWAKQGHQVDVVAAWFPGAARKESLGGVNVFRVGGALFERARMLFSQGTGNRVPRDAQSGHVGRRQDDALRRIAKRIHDHTWKLVYWPDYAVPWYFAARRQTRRCLAEKRYDAMITVSLPFSAHLAGYWVKRRYPALTWLVDVGDPFCFMDQTPPNNQMLYARLNVATERRIFSTADAISVTTEGTRDRYAAMFPESAARIVVIPPLLSRHASAAPGAVLPRDEKIRLVFIGTLYRAIRSPDFLLRLFARLRHEAFGERLELHFFGQIEDCERSFTPYETLLGQALVVHGRVPPAMARQAMREADILVNIGNATSYQLPSKLVEYVSAGKRILNIAMIPEDASTRFLREYPWALSLCRRDGEPDDAMYARLVEFVARNIDEETAGKAREEWSRRFDVEAIAPMYDAMLVKPETRFRPDRETRTPRAADAGTRLD